MLNYCPASTRKHIATAKERDDILANLSTNAFVLYEVYLSKAGKKNYDFSDRNVQKTLHYWNLSKIKRARLELTRAGYFTKTSIVNPQTHKVEGKIIDLRQANYKKYFGVKR